MLKKLILAAAALLIAAPALADNGHRHGHGQGHYKHYKQHYGWKHHPRPVVVMPPPRVYYAPPPRVIYAPPRPVYHAPVYRAPAPASGISIRLHFPL
jgi:hypothetical protein